MMKKSIKLIAVIIAALTCLTVFASCGNKTTVEKTDVEKTDSEKTDWGSIKDAGKLVIGYTEYEPMNYKDKDGTLVGFDTEFAKAVCKKLGVEASFVLIDWDTKEANLKAKNFDCIWNGLTVSKDRKANMDFTKTYLINKQVVVINKDNADTYTSTETLANGIVTAESGSAGETAIKADKNLNKATLTGAETQTAALTSLSSGNADAAVVDYTLARSMCGKGDYTDLVIVEKIVLADEEYAIGFRTGSDITAKVNDVIDELIEDGTLKTIAEKYDLTDLYEAALSK